MADISKRRASLAATISMLLPIGMVLRGATNGSMLFSPVAIAKPGGLTDWHPFMEKHITNSWDGIGYDLRVTENGKRPNRAIWRITPVDENKCILRITGEVDFIKKLPLPIRWTLLKFKLKPLYTQYLFQILEGFAHYAETGKRVTRDQFGPHPFFSK